MSNLFVFVDSYTVFYPIIMSLVWLIGAALSGQNSHVNNDDKSVAIVMSVYNEESTITAMLRSIEKITHKRLITYIVDDKSTDSTVDVVKQFMVANPELDLRLIELQQNGGKARAINVAIANFVDTDFVMVTDADALLDSHSVTNLLRSFTTSSIGAVTGKPVVRNRTTLLGTMQSLEYLAIVDNIKRSQNFLLSKIMTVSGVLVMYRTEALKEMGGFNPIVMTEDIDATWRLYKSGWQVAYEPTALTYILVPERVKGFLKQRKRWAVGGLEVLIDNLGWVTKNGTFGGKALQYEMILSHLWAWTFMASLVNYIVFSLVVFNLKIVGSVLLLYALIGGILMVVAYLNDRADSKITVRDLLVWPLFFLFYWLANLVSAIRAEITVLFGKTGQGVWDSPDRGI